MRGKLLAGIGVGEVGVGRRWHIVRNGGFPRYEHEQFALLPCVIVQRERCRISWIKCPIGLSVLE